MKSLFLTVLLSVFAITPVFAEEQPFVIGNNSSFDFSTLDSQGKFVIKDASLDEMITGNVSALLFDEKWPDNKMADYSARFHSKPLVLILAAFNAQKEADLKLQSEIFSTRSGDKLLYLYLNNSEPDTRRIEAALYLSQEAQSWFSEQQLMAIPASLIEQNRVTLGLQAPLFSNGYK